jgi:hypothetical protein
MDAGIIQWAIVVLIVVALAIIIYRRGQGR